MIITAREAKQISFNSKAGFIKFIEIAVQQQAQIGKCDATVTIPRGLYDVQGNIRDTLEQAGYEILIETRQGCCMPDERVMYINWDADYVADSDN